MEVSELDMEQPYVWDVPYEQSMLRASIQRDSSGFAPLADSNVDQTIPAYFALKVAQRSGQWAVKGRRHSYTYSELDNISNAIASSVLEEGGDSASGVALFLDHDAQMVAC